MTDANLLVQGLPANALPKSIAEDAPTFVAAGAAGPGMVRKLKCKHTYAACIEVAARHADHDSAASLMAHTLCYPDTRCCPGEIKAPMLPGD